MLKHSPGMDARLRNMPLFCMETALKLLLWSDVAYECVVEPDGPLGPPKQVEKKSFEPVQRESSRPIQQPGWNVHRLMHKREDEPDIAALI